jgi:dTDP-4-dehydrorhamnose reductase
MNEHKILITGANGQLGKELQRQYPQAQALGSTELDITNPDAIKTFDWSAVEIIINAAAYTNVDGAETTEGRKSSWTVNAAGVANLAKAATEHNLTLVHVSSEYVFDGLTKEHTETEALSPLSTYGSSKAAGDIAAAMAEKHYIIRTTWVIGEGKNFVRTMLGLGEKGIAPTVVADQIGRLTFTTELVRGIDYLLQHKADYGVYNLSNGGEPASWADITRAIFKCAGHDLAVGETTTEEYFAGKEGIAPRPLQSTLDLSKVIATGFEPNDWRDDLVNYVKKEQA